MDSSANDRVFEGDGRVDEFVFDAKVAAVFDDMIRRSVPFYDEVQRMVVELGAVFLEAGGIAYDIGCSTGTTIAALAKALPPSTNVKFIGIEPSGPMLEEAARKLSVVIAEDRLQLIQSDVQGLRSFGNAKLITMLFTLQFIRPIDRLKVITKLWTSLLPGGCFVLAEKVLADEDFARRLYIDLYHRYKQRKGYSNNEITRKREALENVLIPYRCQENVDLLRSAGFSAVEIAFRWYNFALYIAKK